MAGNVKQVVTGAAGGAAMGAPLGPIGMGAGALIGGGLGYLMGGGDNSAPQAPAAQFAGGNGSALTNQLAAQQYAAGLQQQQAQNAREAAFYNQANGNFDIANAAQMRGVGQIQSSQDDINRQLAALQATQNAGVNLNNSADRLTAMGTNPMGDSYAAAQLKQGQAAAMAQQLSMARSGRSLGSGQAAMNQAMFSNAATNQVTNQQAAAARIQEQQNYNQFQLGALGQAGQQYGAAGSVAGQAGQLATGIRQGNEGVQQQNIANTQQQQQVNNQTTGLYNSLGTQQQASGMQANQLGQQAQQFGATQGQNAQTAQLNANVGQTSSTTATNIANQNNNNAQTAAMMNGVSSGLGAAANALVKPAPNAPAGNRVTSDERMKKNISPLEATEVAGTKLKSATPAPARPSLANAPLTYGSAISKADGSKSTPGSAIGKSAGSAFGEYVADRGEEIDPDARQPSYAETIARLNAGYARSQAAPADVLNRVSGSGAGPSTSQQALLAHMGAAPPQVGPRAESPVSGRTNQFSYTAPTAQQQYGNPYAAPVFSTGMQGYLGGAYPGADPGSGAAPPEEKGILEKLDDATGGDDLKYTKRFSVVPGIGTSVGAVADLGRKIFSDERSKTRIKDLESQLAALQGPQGASAGFRPQAPDTSALDAAYRRQGGEPSTPAVDLRAARGYSYEYKDPTQPGTAPGRQIGPMAQDLEHTTAAPAVIDTPQGKQVDTDRLTMVNTAALSELQRKLQALEASRGPEYSAHNQSLYPSPQSPY